MFTLAIPNTLSPQFSDDIQRIIRHYSCQPLPSSDENAQLFYFLTEPTKIHDTFSTWDVIASKSYHNFYTLCQSNPSQTPDDNSEVGMESTILADAISSVARGVGFLEKSNTFFMDSVQPFMSILPICPLPSPPLPTPAFDFNVLSTTIYPASLPITDYVNYVNKQYMLDDRNAILTDDLPAMDGNIKVSAYDFEGNGKHLYLNIIRHVFNRHPLLKLKDIRLTVPHNTTVSKATINGLYDDDFRIYVWSQLHTETTNDVNVNTPPKIWGCEVSCTDDSYGASTDIDTDDVILIKDGDYVVAELRKNCLFILHDAVHKSYTSSHIIFQAIMERVASLVEYDDEKVATLQRYIIDNQQRRYIELSTVIRDSRKRALEGDIRKYKTDIDNSREKLIKSIRFYDMVKDELQSVDTSLDDINSKVGDDFNRLNAHPKIVQVILNSTEVEVVTSMLMCTHPVSKLEHYIGEFNINIDLSDGRLRFINRTHRIDGHEPGMQAPHVFAGGQACLGSLEAALPEYIAKGEISIVVSLAIKFLESINIEDSAGKHICEWPTTDPRIVQPTSTTETPNV